MPAKKTITVEDVEKEIQPKNAPPCGHVNRHHHGVDGKLKELHCVLPAGHDGDHQAPAQKNKPDPQYDEKGRVVKMSYTVEEITGYWNDSASTPAKDIYPQEILQMTLHQKDMVMRMLQGNPAMDVKEAVARAKMTPEWRAISV